MKLSARKLFSYDDPPYTTTSFPHPHPPSQHHRPIATNATSISPPSSSKKLPQHNPPFDSSMALTVAVLLTALFFMGFFSIYIRRLSEDSIDDLSRRRRYRGGSLDHHVSTSRKGLDPTTIQSLPVYSYHGDTKYQIDCAICLSEFEEREWVKTIPFCKHVFHVECIDTWLSSHVSCPVCRETKLFEIKDNGDGCRGSESGHGVSLTSTVDINDSCMEIGTTRRSMRRTSSCSILEQRAALQRTLSF